MSFEELQLIDEIKLFDELGVSCVGLQKEEGVICLTHERKIQVWIKRSNMQYWPSISYNLPVVPTCMEYKEEELKLYVGLTNGIIMEFSLTDDYNLLEHLNSYTGHSHKVTGIMTCSNFLLSSSEDRCLVCHSLSNRKVLTSYQHSIPLTCLGYDGKNSQVITGDSKGNILVCRINTASMTLTHNTKHHQGGVTCLAILHDKSLLASGGVDACICLFELKKFTFLSRLHAHSSTILSLLPSTPPQHLISSTAGHLIKWNLTKPPSSPTEWKESDSCEECGHPFFWNLFQMWQKKALGVRQHHCRMCGRALCTKCCSNTLQVPASGFEVPTKLCSVCYDEAKSKPQTSLCIHYRFPCSISELSFEHAKNIFIVCTSDHNIKRFKADV